ncbi:ATP-binding protein [Pelagicoccus sp. SDUM812003]|uniref:ATP-binding protein n=1 Tax=Pelagicoccus sp. SDUM812003 TaxID=3041267 RepID=UPI0028109562|nr:ATP-binding protein [Pelagicoccus sp. SDUM812003]MDQ8203628.1 response regulator [Pelagicoccus sp. SDUM812003]
MSCLFLFNAEDQILKLSSELLKVLDYEENEARGSDFSNFVVEDSARFKPEPGMTIDQPGYLRRKSGEIVEAQFRCECLDKQSGLYAMEVTLDRPSDKDDRSNGQSQSGDESGLEFLTTVSHELRVALNGVIGFSNLLGSSNLNEDQRSILEKLQSCNFLLKGLINDVLEYSRVATSKIDLTPETVHLESFVRDVTELFRERASKKGLELKVTLEDEVDRTIAISKLRVTQVLSNLISNAIKFTEVGWVGLAVSVTNETLSLDVQDTGPGIEESERESVFKPFVQFGKDSGSSEGSGLGLAISKGLVEKMGGTLRFSTPATGGSLFAVRLPLAQGVDLKKPRKATVPNPRRMRSKAPVARSKEDTRHILVVEDNQLNADILSHFLNDYGATFELVDNGRSAVDRYQDDKYDLILMDVMLPEMNGFEATEAILAKSRRPAPVPIIGVTAKVFRRDQLRCIESGMAEVVHKPVDFKHLREVLDFHLYGKKQSPAPVQKDADRVGRAKPAKESMQRSGDDAFNANTLEEYIVRMKSGGASRNEVVNTALQIVDAEVQKLLDTIESGDRKETGLRAHSLKGALALLGARGILDLSKGLEILAGDEGTPIRKEHWKALISAAYSEFKDAIAKYLETTSAAS